MIWIWFSDAAVGGGISGGLLAAMALLALLIDRILGDPPWLYRYTGHPVQWIGLVISWLDRRLNSVRRAPAQRRRRGIAAMFLIVAAAGIPAMVLAQILETLPGGWILEAAIASVFFAHHSLLRHVRAVAVSLQAGLDAGRQSVAHIVGRDPEQLDRAAVGRAAVESLAENYADGVVAPLFWLLLAGLPGLVVYKAVNTADSMIGYRTRRYIDFGWAAAKLDDVLNWLPARLTALLFIIAGLAYGRNRAAAALRAVRRDAGHHRSPNAGWPEAAIAGALGLALAGPRHYDGGLVHDYWMGDGRAEVTARDIRRAVTFVDIAHLGAMVTLAAGILLNGIPACS